VIAVLVFSCNRVTVQRCLDALIKYRPSKLQFPIVVTQDCDHEPTAQVIARFGDNVTHIRVSLLQPQRESNLFCSEFLKAEFFMTDVFTCSNLTGAIF
jgi:GNT-I family